MISLGVALFELIFTSLVGIFLFSAVVSINQAYASGLTTWAVQMQGVGLLVVVLLIACLVSGKKTETLAAQSAAIYVKAVADTYCSVVFFLEIGRAHV